MQLSWDISKYDVCFLPAVIDREQLQVKGHYPRKRGCFYARGDPRERDLHRHRLRGRRARRDRFRWRKAPSSARQRRLASSRPGSAIARFNSIPRWASADEVIALQSRVRLVLRSASAVVKGGRKISWALARA